MRSFKRSAWGRCGFEVADQVGAGIKVEEDI